MIPVIYLLDQIPFKNYNVIVSDSSNLFDKASVKENQKKDWSDEHGYDVDLQSRYHNSKTITIDCFIPANSLKECIEKYNDFYNALDKKGSRRLSVIAGDLRMEYQVFRQDTAENKLIYDDSNAAGTFKLKLIENMPVKRILKSYNQHYIKLYQEYFDEYLINYSNKGRNLFLNSPNFLLLGSDSGNNNASYIIDDYIKIKVVANGNIYNNENIKTSIDRLKNEQYTLSFEVSTIKECRCYFFPSEQYIDIIIPNTSGKWEKIIFNYTQQGDDKFSSEHILFGFHDLIAGDEILYRNLKLEKGNKATDWTPAPEDFQLKTLNFLNQISSDNILLPTEKTQLKNKVDEIKNQFNELITKQSISNNLQIRYNEMIAFSDFILKDLNSNSTVNSKLTTITLKSKKVLIINWGDGTEEYTSSDKEVYSHRYSSNDIYFPMILGDLDSITLFNTNADVLWNRF